MVRYVSGEVRVTFAVMSLAVCPAMIAADSSDSPGSQDRREVLNVQEQRDRFRLGVVGLEHGHIYGFLYAASGRSDVELVGMAEPQEELLRRYGQRHDLNESLWYTDLEMMLDASRPEAVAVFTDTKEHLRVVQVCAPRGIHVMVEKPLAVSAADAHAMAKLAHRHGIHVLVNYETTWYPNRREALDVVRDTQKLGSIRRMVATTGHPGPKEIGVPREFMAILTDPELNGAGALYDFGCYGAVNMTCLMGGQRPLRVSAITTRSKKDPVYARVDDDATIVLEYPGAHGVIQASWRLPFNRKDLEVYGDRGHYLSVGTDRYRLRIGPEDEKESRAQALASPQDDPISYLMAVVHGTIRPSGPSALEVNVIVSEILDAARESARTGSAVTLEQMEGP